MNDSELTNVEEPEVAEREAQRCDVQPRYVLNEREGAVEIVVDLPGIARGEVELEVEGRRLTLRTHGVPAAEPTAAQLVSREFQATDFERSFVFRFELAADRVEAVLEHGVLRLTVARSKPERTRISVG
jgi:HSP20 family protein